MNTCITTVTHYYSFRISDDQECDRKDKSNTLN